MFTKRIPFIFFLLSFSLLATSQSADEVIARYIAFTGGVEQWNKVSTITSSGTYNYGGLEFPFKAWSKAPDLYKYEVTAKGKSFMQAFDGVQGWKIDGFKNETQKTLLTGKNATAMSNECDVELESPFINYQGKGHSIELTGKHTVGKKVCFTIKLTLKTGDMETYYFDTSSYELVKKQAVSHNPELDNSLLDILYGDYRKTGGILVPAKITCIVKGQTILVIIIQNIQLNLPVDDSIFKP
jgi:outer membrane lipoprotein-sorting protein